jgi:hypothetical protein
MGLVTLGLPQPRRMRGRWAAFAAVCAARGWGDGCNADGPVWHFDDGGGNWADLHHVGAGRAVLIGHDHEYSDTYFDAAAEYFQEPETDLLAEAPGWWAPPALAAIGRGLWVGFVYGYEDGVWRRAEYEVSDGFTSVGLPAVDDEGCRELVIAHVKDAPGLAGRAPDPPCRRRAHRRGRRGHRGARRGGDRPDGLGSGRGRGGRAGVPSGVTRRRQAGTPSS